MGCGAIFKELRAGFSAKTIAGSGRAIEGTFFTKTRYRRQLFPRRRALVFGLRRNRKVRSGDATGKKALPEAGAGDQSNFAALVGRKIWLRLFLAAFYAGLAAMALGMALFF